MSTTQAHVADIGRLLLSVQNELRDIRGAIGTDGVGSNSESVTSANIENVLARAESHLRAKAEVVLRTAANERAVTLPAIPRPDASGSDYNGNAEYGLPASGRSGGNLYSMSNSSSSNSNIYNNNYRGINSSNIDSIYDNGGSGNNNGSSEIIEAKPPPGRRVHPRFRRESMTASAQVRAQVDSRRFGDPSAAVSHRAALEQRFGVPRPREPVGNTQRPVGNTSRLTANATVRKGKLAPAPNLLPSLCRKDPTRDPPPVTEGTVRKYGMYHLMKSGFIPPDADLTEAMLEQGMGNLFTSGAAKLHPPEEAFVRHEGMISLRNNTDAVKFDLATPVEKTRPKRHKPPLQSSSQNPNDPELDDLTMEDFGGLAILAGAEESGAFGQGAAGGADPAGKDSAEDAPAGGGADPSSGPGGVVGAAGVPRTYDELMDEFSLHHFIIRHGKTITQTPEFESFERRNEANWGAIMDLVRRLETLLANYAVPFAYVNGPRVASLARDEVHRPTREELLSCFLNEDTVRPIFERPGQRYRGKNGIRAAATAIQSLWRMFHERRRFVVNRVNVKAVVRIQSLWRMLVAKRDMVAKLETLRVDKHKRWASLQSEFRETWGKRYESQKRVIIHMHSLSLDVQQRRTLPDLAARQNAQMSRLCDIDDPNVDIVYIAPFPLPEDLLQYYNKLLQIACPSGANPSRRYKIVHPENHARFPAHMSLAQLVLYSPRCLKKLKALVRGKAAYIQPNIASIHEVELAIELGVPLMGADPATADLLATKTGAKAIFNASGVATAPCASENLFDEQATMVALSGLIAQHLEVPRWIFKIDDEFGGRGHAYIDVDTLPCYEGLVQEKKSSMEIWQHPSVQEAVARQIVEDLRAHASEKVVVCRPRLYRSWAQFISVFTRVGGLIEACPAVITGSPSVNLFITPDRRVEILNAHDQFFGKAYAYAGALFPQSSAPFPALRDASLEIARSLAGKGVMGHVGIDFVTFPEDSRQRMWAVDINLRPTDTVNAYRLFNFVLRGTFDATTGKYTSPVGPDGEPRPRTYVVADFLSPPNLATVGYNVFFGLCRQRGITFDLQEKVGTVFNIMDNLSRGYIGIACAGATYADSLMEMVQAMSFIQQQIGGQDDGSNKESRAQLKAFQHMTGVVRAMLAQEREIQQKTESSVVINQAVAAGGKNK